MEVTISGISKHKNNGVYKVECAAIAMVARANKAGNEVSKEGGSAPRGQVQRAKSCSQRNASCS